MGYLSLRMGRMTMLLSKTKLTLYLMVTSQKKINKQVIKKKRYKETPNRILKLKKKSMKNN